MNLKFHAKKFAIYAKEKFIKYYLHVIVFCIAWLLGASFGMYYCAKTFPTKTEFIKSLGDNDRKDIAIDYACSPNQKWKGFKQFCGSQIFDGRLK